MPHEPVCASHRHPESWLHCVGRFAYVSEHDDWHCPPVKRHALYVAQSVAVLPAQLKTQFPYPLTWHCASAAQFAWLPHDATHVPAVYMQLGLRVHGVCDAPDSVTAEHCVKHDWRFESHWHRGSVAHDACDGYATEHVRVCHFNVGWVLTPGEYELKQREGLPPGWSEAIGPKFAPSGRLLSPENIAHFALAFVEPGAGAVNGAVVDLEQYPVIGRNPPKEVSDDSGAST